MPDTDMNKRKTLSILGRLFRDHKSDLVTDWMLQDLDPCKRFNISKDDWKEFCEKKQSAAFQVYFVPKKRFNVIFRIMSLIIGLTVGKKCQSSPSVQEQ